jgi:hypothetical protein
MEMDLAKIGAFDLDKGLVRKNVKMFAWDGIRDCYPECPMIDECKYLHKGKCAVQVQYAQALYKAILGTYTYLDEPTLFKVGTELIPLYVQLSRFQIIELSLPNPIIYGNAGPKMHPIYNEIRDTLRCIHTAWKGLEMSFDFGERINLNRKEKEKAKDVTNSAPDVEEKKIDYERGDPNFYKKISQEGTSRKGIIR